MKPLVATQLHRIEQELRELQAALQESTEEQQRHSAEREQLLQENWRLKKETSTHQHASQEYESLAVENQQLHSLHAELRARLLKVLAHTKALGAEFHE